MLDFTTQKQLLDPILKDPRNQHCADCDSISPTWASLDFGVFLCSNCSGAHRGLGPTVTRVRSANLDKWQQEWLNNMQLGNSQINLYWEADSNSSTRKPKAGDSLQEISRFVYEKYIKRKFVTDRSEQDPLTQYKNGNYSPSKPKSTNNLQTAAPKQSEQVPTSSANLTSPSSQISLLDLHYQQPSNQQQPIIVEEEEEFTDFAQAGSLVDEQHKKEGNFISFDNLLNQQQQPNTQSTVGHVGNFDYIRQQNMQLHHTYNPHLQHNMVYNQQFQQGMGQRNEWNVSRGGFNW